MTGPEAKTVVQEAAAAFWPDGATCRVERLGEGNINDTFLVESGSGRFVLQKINARVFPAPLRVIENFVRITEHLLQKRRDAAAFLTAEAVRTVQGASHYLDREGGFWRAQTYLAGAAPGELPEAQRIRRAGRTLARFHCLAADLDVARLRDPLPGFHHLPGYLAELDRVLAGRPRPLDETAGRCLAMIEQQRADAARLEDARQAGILKVQPIHGDPKIDNFIFSATGNEDGMLDFDTVGPGLVHYDLGDCLRSCCNRAGEAGGDPAAVAFDLDRCRLLLEGYFSGCPPFAQEQRNMIHDAVALITLELGIRFFTDHLRGNTYFKVATDGDNLARAARQFRLFEDIAGKKREILRIIEEAARQPDRQSSSPSIA